MKDVDSYIPLFCVCAAEKKKKWGGRPLHLLLLYFLRLSFLFFFFTFHPCLF